MKESEKILNEILEIIMLNEKKQKNLNFYEVMNEFLNTYIDRPEYRLALSYELDDLIASTSKQEDMMFDEPYEYEKKRDVSVVAKLLLKIKKLEKEEDLEEKQFNMDLLNKITVLYKIYDKTNNNIILNSLKGSCDTIKMGHRKH